MDDNTQPMTDDQVTGDQIPAVPADDQSASVPVSEDMAESAPVIEKTPEMSATEVSTEEVLPEASEESVEEGESFEDPAEDLGQPAL